MATRMDFLKQIAKGPTTAKSKQGIPVIELSNTKENREAITTWIEQRRIEKTAETIRKQQEDVLRSAAEEAREKHCLDNGYSAAVKIQVDDQVLQFTCPCKYSKIPPETEAKLKEIFGEELYKKYFRLVTEISLTEKAMKVIEQGGDLLDRLVKAVGGPQAFQETFTVEQHVEPLESFHMDRVRDKQIVNKSKKAIEDKLIRPTTPSFSPG